MVIGEDIVKCSRCKNPAVIELKCAGQFLCKNCFSTLYEHRVGKTIAKNGMLSRKDKVAVGVSGGKDSLVLLYLMKKFHYKPTAVVIDEGIKGYRNETIGFARGFCKKEKIPLHIFSFGKEFGKTLDEIAGKRENICSFCGVMRRKLLNNAARKLKCTKLAVGHNLDDEAQTALMNFIHAEFPRLARSEHATGIMKIKGFVPRIKPLRECPEKEDVLYALLHGIKYSDKECPYAGQAYRSSIRNVLNELEEKYPGTKFAILRSSDKLTPILKNQYKTGEKPEVCIKCGEPSAKETCRTCTLLEKAAV